jgi:hypothetical protein
MLGDKPARASRELLGSEILQVMKDPTTQIIEWGVLGFTWMTSAKHLAIVRAGALGGDIRDVHGGWKYANLILYLRDREELLQVAANVV